MSAAFHLNNKEAKRELKVKYNNEKLPLCSEPKYLGVTLDRSITYRRHRESLRKKPTSRITLLWRLAGSGWGVGATTLGRATLALVHSTAEYCAPAWCRSAHSASLVLIPWCHTTTQPHNYTTTQPVAYEAWGREGLPPPRFVKFRTNSVFRASTTC